MKSELLRPDKLVKLYIQNVSKDRVTSATYQSYGFPLFDMRKTENICNKESKHESKNGEWHYQIMHAKQPKLIPQKWEICNTVSINVWSS